MCQGYQQGVPRPMSNFSSPETPSNEFVIPSDDWSLVTKVALASLSSQVTLVIPNGDGYKYQHCLQGTMGGLLVGGLLLKTVGWRVIAVSATIYGTVMAELSDTRYQQ